MEKIFIISFLITFIFCVMKFLEAKYLDKEWKPLKYFVRDAIIVLISTALGSFIFFQNNNAISELFNVVTETKTLNTASTQIFTDAPGF
jgi:TctA family transporter